MKFSLFLGCITPHRYPGIESATRKVCEKLNIELIEMEEASCCPAPGAFRSIDTFTWLALGARNLALAEENKADIITVCSGCYGSLHEVNFRLREDSKIKRKVNKILSKIGRRYDGKREVRHIVEVFYRDIGIDKIQGSIAVPMEALKVAIHYGCHLLKPSSHRWGIGSERPQFLEMLVEATGAKSVEYKDKLLCCGAGGGVRASNLEEALDIAFRKLKNIRDSGADLIVNPCSFCTLHFDTAQPMINEKYNENFNIPVLHYVQFLGLAMGIGPKKLGLSKHVVSLDRIVEKAGI